MPRPLRVSRGRWVVALVPAAVVGVIELLSDTLLDEYLPFPWDTILVTAAVLVISLLVAWFAFGRIDALTGALTGRNAELEARAASARALNRVSLAIASLSDVEEVLQAVVDHARRLLAADVAVLLLEGDDAALGLRVASGPVRPVDAPAMVSRDAEPGAPIPSGVASGAGHRARARAVHAPTPADEILRFVDAADARVRLSAPLQRGGETIGYLAVGAREPRGFDADELETLASLANQATIALEHARLEQRLRELAVVDERERIARELHDGIAQVLGYVNTKSQAIDGYLAAGRTEVARTQLAELGAAARAVYVDVREAILGLRSALAPGEGLGAAIEAHATRVAADGGFALELDVEPAARGLKLDTDAASQVFRIAQEALTNVRKHAGARRVVVRIAVDTAGLALTIADDGRGLGAAGGTGRPDAAGDVPHYGLRSMRERAEAIGAQLSVEDGRGGGVTVSLRLPLPAATPAQATPSAAGGT